VLPTWRRQKKPAAEEQDVDDPLRSLLRKLQLKQLQKILGSANPAELVVRILQQLTWTLMMLLRSTGRPAPVTHLPPLGITWHQVFRV